MKDSERIKQIIYDLGHFIGALNERNDKALEEIAGDRLPPDPSNVVRLHMELYDEYEVYQRGDVIGTLAAFRIKQEGKRKYIRNGIIDMYHHNGKDGENTDEHDIAVIHFEKGYVRITRQPSDSINITDADFGNIIIEIEKEVSKENLSVLYFHESPVYWFDGSQMYQMKSEFISLPWEMRL